MAGVLLWSEGERMPLDVFSYIREATRAFEFGCFLGSITLASCAVETILNKDSRMRSIKKNNSLMCSSGE